MDAKSSKRVKVRGLVSAAGNDYSLAPGVEVELPEHVAADCVKAKHAELVKPAKTKAGSTSEQDETE